jgi:hypothetical protein
MTYRIFLVHKHEEPVTLHLARVPVRGDFIEHAGGPWEVKRVLLRPADSPCDATVWADPVDFPLSPPSRHHG